MTDIGPIMTGRIQTIENLLESMMKVVEQHEQILRQIIQQAQEQAQQQEQQQPQQIIQPRQRPAPAAVPPLQPRVIHSNPPPQVEESDDLGEDTDAIEELEQMEEQPQPKPKKAPDTLAGRTKKFRIID